MNSNISAFSLKNINKNYGNVLALQDVTLDAKKGAIGLLGPNGAGKSTMIKILLGLVKPNSGHYNIMNHANNSKISLDIIGYMPEHDCLPDNFTAVGFVSYMGALAGMPRDDSLERTHDILDFVDLGEERYRKLKGFSAGMKQKVKLAQAMVHDPEIIFFDEPTNGLDPEGRRDMLNLLKQVSNSGKSLVLSTHLLPDVEEICKDVIIMDSGKIILYDELKSVLGSLKLTIRIKGNKDRFLKALKARGIQAQINAGNLLVDIEKNISRDIFEAAKEQNVQIRYMASHSKTLEDLFLQLVGDGTE